MGKERQNSLNTIFTMEKDDHDLGPVRGLVSIEHDIHDLGPVRGLVWVEMEISVTMAP